VADATALLSSEDFGWQEMIAMIETPPASLEGDGPIASRNPFTPVAKEPVVPEPETEIEVTSTPVIPPAEITPASLQMKLTGVFVMRNDRVAIIDGAGYRRQDLVEVDSVTPNRNAEPAQLETEIVGEFAAARPTAPMESFVLSSPVAFEVSAIHADAVELTRNGNTYTLQLQGETKNKAIEVTRYKARRLP